RQWDGTVGGRFSSNTYQIDDWNFESGHWTHWEQLANKKQDFWWRLLCRFVNDPNHGWRRCLFAEVKQIAERGRGAGNACIAAREIPAAWIIRFRELPCLRDTRGKSRRPAELLR